MLWSSIRKRLAHLDELVEVGVLARRVLVLVEEVVDGLRAQQQLHLPLLVVEGSVVILRQAADVGQPEGGGGGPLAQQVEGQRHVAHRLQDPVLLVQRPWQRRRSRLLSLRGSVEVKWPTEC